MSTRAESKDPDGAGAARECGKEFLTVHSISQRELKQPPQLLLACWGSSTALLLLRDSNYAQDDSAELLPGQDALATAGRCRRYAFLNSGGRGCDTLITGQEFQHGLIVG